jgi:putative acetyltransferase
MACGQTGWTFHEEELSRDDVRALLALHFAEMRGSSPPEACHVMPADALAAPGIRFLSLRDASGRLLGIGALKDLGVGHGEIKSMRTAPDALGLGVGGALLDHLMAMARTSGMTRISLETGSGALFDAANRLYVREGFERCAPFGGYNDTPFTRFYTRAI